MAFHIDMSKPVAYVRQITEGYYVLYANGQEIGIGGTSKARLERYARSQGFRIANFIGLKTADTRTFVDLAGGQSL